MKNVSQVDKQDYYVHEHIGGYYSIKSLAADSWAIVWGDSADEDCNRETAEAIYSQWNGELVDGMIDTAPLPRAETDGGSHL